MKPLPPPDTGLHVDDDEGGEDGAAVDGRVEPVVEAGDLAPMTDVIGVELIGPECGDVRFDTARPERDEGHRHPERERLDG